MTRLLEKAFKEASKLPVVEQNALAKWVFEECVNPLYYRYQGIMP